jgi:hypothetical protein
VHHIFLAQSPNDRQDTKKKVDGTVNNKPERDEVNSNASHNQHNDVPVCALRSSPMPYIMGSGATGAMVVMI